MKICMISLGCDKNLVDSEMMLGYLSRGNVSFTDEAEDADVIFVNTCCFILDAKDESIRAILDAAKLKEGGRLKALIVTGCMAERYRKEILDEIPEVDAVVGTTAWDEISGILDRVLDGERVEAFRELSRLPASPEARVLSTMHYYGYLKIAEGCDKHCTYCIIPSLRGKFRSVPMGDLLRQAEQLAEAGVKELILVAQETTVYGQDLYGKKKLPALLRKLCRVKGIRWIRILYCYPEEITDELIEVMASETKICHYLDLPIQHASDDVLRRMGRRTSREDLVRIIGKLRAAMPDIALRTTLISGFPGETEEDHGILKDFVREMKFERLGGLSGPGSGADQKEAQERDHADPAGDLGGMPEEKSRPAHAGPDGRISPGRGRLYRPHLHGRAGCGRIPVLYIPAGADLRRLCQCHGYGSFGI